MVSYTESVIAFLLAILSASAKSATSHITDFLEVHISYGESLEH